MINYETDIQMGREFTADELEEFCYHNKGIFMKTGLLLVFFYKNHAYLCQYQFDSEKYMITRSMIDWGDID